MSSYLIHSGHSEEHVEMTRKKIWNVFSGLLAITWVEFFIALYLVPKGYVTYQAANPIYIILTILKAFFIVAYFMHLKFEKAALIFTIIVPVLFIIGLILVLTDESRHWLDLRNYNRG